MTLESALQGITCPVVTPFDEDSKRVDEAAFGAIVEDLVANDIDGVFSCGTAGEFASLTADERRRVHELAVEHADGSVPVLAGAGATTVSETLEHIEAAAAVGADAAVVVPPYFHTANDPAGNRRFFETVADASPLPLLLYNIPLCTGRRIHLETVESVATHENVIGLKDSGGDLQYFLSVIRRTPDSFLVLQGFDTLVLPSIRMGGDGGVNTLSNVAPAQYAELYETADRRRAREVQDAVASLFESCAEYGFAPGTKTALASRGGIPSDTVRLPLVSVPEEGRATIATQVEAVLNA
ncbi:dihydrodipicolinate synthase family protein [Natrarchaeobius halalkaliphilus]|uniref:Dihydrodipicolinate synthase family protein n=1 Tax=Natrarchaeobius halalkaliphilus TaxID=1679091 RepID=A0A3N6MQL3_9EURY|nr:dihydrodipicolinate synthase family protein [Natrarchaeobius halalkaliphilus]RQG86109.1 dihydrodipicolinate synthase family protein [Natrarchaeobius halalkaliphilus]